MDDELDAIHGQIVEALVEIPPQSWSLSEASFILAAIRRVARSRESFGNVVSIRCRRRGTTKASGDLVEQLPIG